MRGAVPVSAVSASVDDLGEFVAGGDGHGRALALLSGELRFAIDRAMHQLGDGVPVHLELDGSSGSVRRSVVGVEAVGPHEHPTEGSDLWFLQCDSLIEGLPALSTRHQDVLGFAATEQFVRVSGDSLKPDAALGVYGGSCDVPGWIAGEHLWHGSLRVDLESGDWDLWLDEQALSGVAQEDRYFVSTTLGVYRIEDGGTVELFRHGVEFDHVGRALGSTAGLDHLTPARFAAVKYWDGRYWVSGESQGGEATAVEFDPVSGVLSDPISVDEVPTRSFEVGDHRWEFFDGDWHHDRATGELTSGWRVVGARSGELVGQYDFGRFEPIGGFDDMIWFVDYDRGELGRLPLSTVIDR